MVVGDISCCLCRVACKSNLPNWEIFQQGAAGWHSIAFGVLDPRIPFSHRKIQPIFISKTGGARRRLPYCREAVVFPLPSKDDDLAWPDHAPAAVPREPAPPPPADRVDWATLAGN